MGFKPPRAVAFAASKGLELHSFYLKDLNSKKDDDLKRAQKLLKRKPLTAKALTEMQAFYKKHLKNKDTLPSKGKGQITWLLWGGDAGRRWVNRKLRKLNK